MGIFGKKSESSSELNAFLGVGTEYCGKLQFVGTVRIDGRFEGEITSDGALVLGRTASVKGVIKVGMLTSCGRIEGDVSAAKRAKLEKNSVLVGSLSTPKLVMEQGAVLEGGITMSEDKGGSESNVVAANFGNASITQQKTASVDNAGPGAING